MINKADWFTIAGLVSSHHQSVNVVDMRLDNPFGCGFMSIKQGKDHSYNGNYGSGSQWSKEFGATCDGKVDTVNERIILDMDSLAYPLTPSTVRFDIEGKPAVSKFLHSVLPFWLRGDYNFNGEDGLQLYTFDKEQNCLVFDLKEEGLKIYSEHLDKFSTEIIENFCQKVNIEVRKGKTQYD